MGGNDNMDGKRKVNGGGNAAGEDLDERATKRRKLPSDHNDLSGGETADTTTHYGLKLLDLVKKTEDKGGRLVATAFLKLPSKREVPDYYQVTRMPIALDTIESKLNRREFPTLTTLESYFKRMVQNAKDYNQKGSLIFEDAERVRKAVSNFMTKTNPAYKTPGYVAFSTPFPEDIDGAADDDDDDDPEGEQDSEEENTPTTKRRGRPPKNSQVEARIPSATPAKSESKDANAGYEGLTFQLAQEKVVEDLMREKDLPDDDFPTFALFVDLPPKQLKDYYKMIPNPISLSVLQRRVKGIYNKRDMTRVTPYKTWSAFEDEASYLWKNAWHYNEDGSEIFVLATKLKGTFYKFFNEAKKVVPEPAGPKIKLKLPEPPPKITLKFAGGKASPADSPAPVTNGSTSSKTEMNGIARRNPLSTSRTSSTPVPNLDQLTRPSSASGSATSPTPVPSIPVKNEEVARKSPVIQVPNGVRSTSQAVSSTSTPVATPSIMAPPSTPGLATSMYSSGGYAQSFPHQPQYQAPNPYAEAKWRRPGQDAMITNLSLATHPGLNLSQHFRMDLPPSPTTTQQSVTVNLPSTHYYLQIKPTIATSLLERQFKLFVTSVNRLHAMPTIPGHPIDQRHPLFEARLVPGVNRIEVELIAALPKGAKPINGQDFELEKITVFANLMKS